ncbi:hypothetical protein RhiJN_09442 [Ceratobasidium sp. AG-Ba]|nr:hypothetical protein RhiJN_09442 [Ceratobasidium sp. AG-Ba]
MSDYPTRPDTPTGSTFWDVAERLLSGLRWERQRVEGDNCIFRRQMAPEVRHLFADSPLPVYPRYNNRDHYPVEAPEPTQDDPHFEIGWPAPPSPGLEPTPFDMVLMKGWGGRTEHPLAPPKSPSVLSLEEYLERQDRLTQDRDQESSQDSDEEEYEPEVVRTGELQDVVPEFCRRLSPAGGFWRKFLIPAPAPSPAARSRIPGRIPSGLQELQEWRSSCY